MSNRLSGAPAIGPEAGPPISSASPKEAGAVDKPLMERAMNAGVWNMLLRSVVRGAGFLRNVIFARMLAPADIGLFGIALVILSIVDRFSNSGLQAALVQKKESIDDYVDTGWTVQLLRAIALSAVCMIAAPWVAIFFGEPSAAPLVRALSVYLLIRALTSPATVLLRREMEVHRQIVIRTSATVANLVVSVMAAVIIKSAWALMIGLIASAVAMVVSSYIVQPYRPRLRVDLQQVRELSTFGRWVFLNNVLFFLAYRGDNFVVGKLFGSAGLGVYLLAYSISEVATVEIARIMTDVAMPAYSRAQDNLERVRRGFLLAIELVLSVTVPAAVILVVLAGPIVHLVLGERWLPAAAVLPALALAGPLRCFHTNATSLYAGLGKPDYSFRQNLLGVVVTYLLMLPLAHWLGLAGVGFAVFGGTVATLPYAVYHIRELLGLRVSEILRPFVPSLVLSAAVLLAILGTLSLFDQPTLPVNALAVLSGMAAYGVVAWALWARFRSGPLSAYEMFRARRRRRAKRHADAVPAGAAS